jgi:hypothetical protein
MQSLARWIAMIAPLFFTFGCSSSVDSTASGTTAGSTGDNQGGGLPSCDAPPKVECDLPSPCPTAELQMPYGGTGEPTHYNDVEAADCVLAKLRDREVSKLVYWADSGYIPGQFRFTEEIFVLDGEHAASNWFDAHDLSVVWGVRNRQILKPPSYFQGCIDMTDHAAKHDCLSAWSDGCSDVDVTCP